MNKPALLIGAGGHAAVLLEILEQLDINVIGYVSLDAPVNNELFDKYRRYTNDEDVFQFKYNEVVLVNGIGSLPDVPTRFKIHQKFKNAGYEFITLASPSAIVSKSARLGEGVQVMPGCIINANANIAEGTIVNSGAIVEHDSVVGKHNHIAPGVVMCGSVNTGEYVHIGTGAKILQNINIGSRVLIGIGATVTCDIASGSKVYVAKSIIKGE